MDVKKLIAALSNPDVAEAFAAALQPTILASFQDLKSTIDSLRDEIAAKNVTIMNLKSEVASLQQENYVLSKSLAKCENRVDLLETYTRVDNLIIKGLPAVYSEVATTSTNIELLNENSDTTMSTVLQFCESSLGLKVCPGDISIAHRLPVGKHDKTQPIIVRFTSRRTRDAVYAARRNLYTAGVRDIYINEHLTKHHEQLFSRCRQLRKSKQIHSTWTWHGITYVKKSQSSRMIKILSDGDISTLSNQDQ